MTKEIKFSDELRGLMFDWIEAVAKAVIVTMWPKGRNVVLEREYGSPLITNDWVTIAREISLEWKFENMWAELVKEAASRTNDFAWDGTTTATLLTYALAKEWLKSIKSGLNAVEIKNWMKKASMLVSEELIRISKKIWTKEEIAQIAEISAQDREVWEIIAWAMEKVWNDWIITVEEGHTFWMSVEITEWMKFDSGYISPYMVTSSEKMTSEMRDAPILITDQKISNMKDLLPLLEEIVNSGRKDLTIIAEDIDGEALTTIILNRLKWVLNVLAIKAPWFADRKKEYLWDLAVLTWATLITKDLGFSLEHASIQHLWNADNIISTQKTTTIIGWKWDKSRINSRVEEIRNQIDLTDSSFEKDKHIERIARLTSGIAVVKVWAMSEVEMKEKKLRIEDALNATRAAINEWIVPWGWVALLKVSKILENIDFWNESQNIWAEIVRNALYYPIKQIVQNAWKNSEEITLKVLENESYNFGYDANNDCFVDMIESWIIDPVMVERVAVIEAVSLAWMFLTTEAWIVSIKKDEKSQNQMWEMPMM